MNEINYETFTDFVAGLPAGSAKAQHEELQFIDLPQNYPLIGTLTDHRLHTSVYSYGIWTQYALGFYPFNDCDIFRDKDDRILLSYVEYGGHPPFRRSFIVNRNSPVIAHPVGFRLHVDEQNHVAFLNHLADMELNEKTIHEQLEKHDAKPDSTHSHELASDT